MVFDAAFPSLKLCYPCLSNFIAIARADYQAALDWAHAQVSGGAPGELPAFVSHLEAAMVSDDTKFPVLTVLPDEADAPVILEGQAVAPSVALRAAIGIVGAEPNALSRQLDTYVLAFWQLWHQAATDDLLDGYSAALKNGHSRQVDQIRYGQQVGAVELKRGGYLRSASMRLLIVSQVEG